MKITFRVMGHLRDIYFEGQEFLELELPEPTTLLEILNHIKLPPTIAMAYLKEGKPINKDTLLRGGEEIIIVSPLSGG